MSNPLKISEAASLALHAAGLMATTEGGPCSAEVIADTLGASRSHLVKVLQRLAKAGLVRSSRGPRGGYSLTRPPAGITAREVYETVEGPIDVKTCAMAVPTCGSASCVLGDKFCRIATEVREQLEGITMADFGVSVAESVCVGSGSRGVNRGGGKNAR
ncbi:MAG: Rrf2 family transcriptional regulator [Candidatus Eisenbacteria bacterium]|nr:Rrf2 family transcriptional regulator [Candidatus Eisenbacteria bacterium]